MMQLPSPVKLNLFLHIVGRRNDGYHNLQSVFQLLDYGDQITLSPAAALTLQAPAGLNHQDNLCWRAAQALQQYTGCRLGAHINLQKTIPVGSGLGAGSSNAATVLLGLNRLWGVNLSIDQLAQIGAGLGADVPVFVRGFSAWAEGTGERLTQMDLPERWYCVLRPEAGVSTAELFQNKSLTRDSKTVNIDGFTEGFGCNAFEPLVRRRLPEVGALIDLLECSNGCIISRMSGTGSAVFGVFVKRFDANAAFDTISAQWPTKLFGFVAPGVNVSTLHQQMMI